MQVAPPQEEVAADKLMPEVGVPSAPFQAKEALMIRPHYLGKEMRYPLIEFYSKSQPVESEPCEPQAPIELPPLPEGPMSKKEEAPILEPKSSEFENYPMLSKVMAEFPPMQATEEPAEEIDEEPKPQDEAGREQQKADNMAKLQIESPDEFGIKYKGELHQMAEEHGVGDILGYSFRTRKIELIGTEKVLLLDYDLKPLHTREIYPVEEK
jgi:hypothetical protein